MCDLIHAQDLAVNHAGFDEKVEHDTVDLCPL
jgi:hypothetical protein